MPHNVKQENHFILLTLFLVLILGIPTLRSLSQDDSPLERGDMPSETHTLELSQESRKPANQSNEATPATNDSTEKEPQVYRLQVENLELDCQSSDYQKTIHSLRLKIQSESCKILGKPDGLKIINESNGFTASVFAKDQSAFTTDLIHLNPGENKIILKDRKTILRTVHIYVKPILDQISEKNP
jgi:hypothetical protein